MNFLDFFSLQTDIIVYDSEYKSTKIDGRDLNNSYNS